MTFDLNKLDSFTLETSKNHLIRNFLHNGSLKVNFKFGKTEKFLDLGRNRKVTRRNGDLNFFYHMKKIDDKNICESHNFCTGGWL